jgi:acyl-coenzyme A synthetase/AMP-(fatty) acid ligase
VLKIVPSHLAALLEGNGGKRVLPRKYLVVGGEKLKRELIEQVEATGVGCEMVNHYAPTETTCGSLTLKVSDFDWKGWAAGRAIPLGRPIANTRLYVLDGEGEPVPVGVKGELYIAGDGVSAGYAGDPRRTVERFLPDPFQAGGTMYRSGDLVRYLADGKVEFLDRADDQVKIRGYRVELGEVEEVLKGYGGVKQAVVLAREDERGDKRLLGYVVAERDATLEGGELREWAKARLPDYMVPVAVMVLPKLPLNANGKIDRQALPEPELTAGTRYAAPGTPTEVAVADVWHQVLRGNEIGIDDDFFDLGGHSLSATQIAARLGKQLGLLIGVRNVFDYPTIRTFAAVIDKNHDDWLDFE